MLPTRLVLLFGRIVAVYVAATLVGLPLAWAVELLMDGVGVPGPVAGVLRGTVGWGVYALALAAIWPPWYSDADIAARKNDFDPHAVGSASSDDAVTAIEALEGVSPDEPRGLDLLAQPIVKRKNADKIAGAVFKGTSTPRERRAVVEALDVETEAVVDRLVGLADHRERAINAVEMVRPKSTTGLGDAPFLVSAVERFARDDPAAVEPHRDRLVETLSADDDRAAGHAALALGHLGREAPEAIEGCVEEIVPLLERAEPSERAVMALGELAAHDPAAITALAELTDVTDPTLTGLLGDIDAHYVRSESPGEEPYPGWERLDEMERSQSRQAQNRTQARYGTMTGADGSTGGDGFRSVIGTYECESCGETLNHHWDMDGADSYTCGNCGSELQDQFGASFVYWDEQHWLEE